MGGGAEENGHSASKRCESLPWRHAPNRACAQPVHDRTRTGQTPDLIGPVCPWTPVPDCSSAPAAMPRWLSAVAVIGDRCIALTVAPILPAAHHSVEPQNATGQPAGADTTMPNASAGSGRVNTIK